MKKLLTLATFILSFASYAHAEEPATTHRTPMLTNDKVNVWETVVYPSAPQQLKMHRHEYNRVLIALTDGTLKVTNDKGQSHLLKLEKNKAYYLEKDVPNELHTDMNISGHPITVYVIELKS